jgi:CRP/FNR family transcriptional regulator
MFHENAALTKVSSVSLFQAGTSRAPTLKSLFGGQPVESFESGTSVFWQGDAANHVFEVVEGVLRIFKMMSDGRRVITGFIYPGDLLGVSLKEQYLYTAEAVTKVRVRRFGRARFQQAIDASPELRPELFARLCDEMAAAQNQMVLLARKSAEERVSSFLLAIARRVPPAGFSPPSIQIPMTRLDMADYLGLTIETVSRVMTRLTGLGVIAASGRHAVWIRKLDKLTLLAGESDEDDNSPSGVNSNCAAVWPH